MLETHASNTTPQPPVGSTNSSQIGGGMTAKDKKYLFGYVFALLLEAMGSRQQGVVLQTKAISANAAKQEKYNNYDAKIRFSVCTAGASKGKVNEVQEQNQAYAAQRENYQNILITLRQTGQVQMTKASTMISILEQLASMNQNFVTVFGKLLNAANGINPASQGG